MPQGKGSVGVCWGRFGQSVHGASDDCFWPAVLATCELFTPQTRRFCGLSSQEPTRLSWRQREEGGWQARENSKWKRQLYKATNRTSGGPRSTGICLRSATSQTVITAVRALWMQMVQADEGRQGCLGRLPYASLTLSS